MNELLEHRKNIQRERERKKREKLYIRTGAKYKGSKNSAINKPNQTKPLSGFNNNNNINIYRSNISSSTSTFFLSI